MNRTAGPFTTTFRRRSAAALLAGSAVFALGIPGYAADKNVAAPANVKRGDALFHQRCAVCHNKQPGDTTPFGPPNLFDVIRNKTVTTSQATEVIVHGKGPMPPFGTTLTSAQIKDVIAYLRYH